MLNDGDHQAAPLPLFRIFPALQGRVPWLPLGAWPTPVTDARHFAAAHDLRAFFVKREDLCHPQCAGNKVRGLEFLLADALHRGAGTIATLGVTGSHHIAKTAWHARQLGMAALAAVVDQPPAEYVRQNIALGLAAGAKYIRANRLTLLPRFIAGYLGAWRREGRRPYLIPPGGTSPLACLGHLSAALELKEQIDAGLLPEPDFLYVPLGSLGTAAGLLSGCKLAGLRTRLVGVVVSHRWYCTPSRWTRLARRVLRLIRRNDAAAAQPYISRSDVSVVTTALGAGYARPTESASRLAAEFHAAEGIELDGTYTAKTLDGAMRFIDRNVCRKSTHLFWHTYQFAAAAQ